jgi:restriction endonuclease S subunit
VVPDRHTVKIAALSGECGIKAVCGRGSLKDWYLARWFSASADNFLRRATEATHGTKKLDRDEIARIYIAVPPPDEQDEIIRRIEQTDTHLALCSDELQKLEATRHGLLADLLTSPLKVMNAIQEGGA